MPLLNSIQRNVLSLAVAQTLLAPIANAARITVNSTLDAQNAVGCTLREAIQVSNSNNLGSTGCQISNGNLNNADEIVFELTGNNTIILSGNELEIVETVSITGPGAEQLTIDANGQSRVLSVTGGDNNSTANTNISALTLTGGNSDYAIGFVKPRLGGSLADGGAINISNSPGSVISNTVITNSVANDGDGGGISVESSDGLYLINTTVSGNSTIDPTIFFSGDRYNRGGGIFISRSSSVSINISTITENTSTLVGGGINIYQSDDVSINNSTVSGNTALVSNGGGISVGQTNQDDAGSENFLINSSTVSNNVALNTSRLQGSTIGGSGGGIYISGSSGIIINSTISGNFANRDRYAGGGIGTSSGTSVNLYSSTIVNNRSIVSRPSSGGGISLGSANFNISGNNVIANNIGGDCNDFYQSLSSGVNWIGDNTCLSISTPELSGDPQLGPLQDNGGPTFTHAPLTGSGLINASTNCDDPLVNGVDQRGELRGTSTCFIGSVEGIENEPDDFIIIPLGDDKAVVIPL